MCAYWFQLILKWICSEWPSVDHMNKVQYLLGCHRRYTAGLLQLSLSTSPVDQPRGDENTARSPLAHTGSKIEARKQFRTFFFPFFAQSGAPLSWGSFSRWPALNVLIRFTIQHRCTTHKVEVDNVKIFVRWADSHLHLLHLPQVQITSKQQ